MVKIKVKESHEIRMKFEWLGRHRKNMLKLMTVYLNCLDLLLVRELSTNLIILMFEF